MWFSFLLAFIFESLALFIPGYLIARALRLDRILTLAVSAPITVALIEIFCIVYAKVGLFTTWTNLEIPIFAFAIVIYVFTHVAYGLRPIAVRPAQRNIRQVILYVAVAAVISLFVMVKGLDTPVSFIQYYDNAFHLNTIRAFEESGIWTSLGAGSLLGQGSGFYPAAMHALAALSVSALHVPASLAENAVMLVFTVFVYPLGALSLMQALFPRNRRAVYFGSITCMACCSFPWLMILWGPVIPNMMAFCMVPAAAAIFIGLLRNWPKASLRLIIAFVLVLIAEVFMQTNAIFTLYLFLAPFLVWQINEWLKGMWPQAKGKRWGIGAVVSIVLILIWLAATQVPFLHGIVHYYHACYMTLTDALRGVVAMTFTKAMLHGILLLVVIVGAAFVIRDHKGSWLIIPFVIACIGFVLAAAVESPYKWLVSGFWYNDYYRMAGMATIFSVPLAAYGLARFSDVVARLLKDTKKQAIAIIAALFIIVTYCPSFHIGSYYWKMPIGDDAVCFKDANCLSCDAIYGDDEIAFVDDAVQIAGDGLVYNLPSDGSVYAYGVNGMNVYYRAANTRGISGNTACEDLLELNLSAIAADESVAAAVKELGIKYVLLLDQGDADYGSAHWIQPWCSDEWSGVISITDATPGFELVLARDDMRLYRIV